MMSDEEAKLPATEEQAAEQPTEPIFTLAEFFEKIPPSKAVNVSDIGLERRRGIPGGGFQKEYSLSRPALELHCGNEKCGGMRTFRWAEGEQSFPFPKPLVPIFYKYVCSNCQNTTKTYSFWTWISADKISGKCYKFGEYPAFGSPTPTRLLRLLGKDRETYIKGRQCENQGLGIGAFAYYRRVVENQRHAIIDEILNVSNKLKSPPEVLKVLSDAKKEIQFSKSVEAIKDGIPQVLFIDGHNPLTLLHSALSEGLHAETDEACLEAAHVIRIVLADLVERVGQALKSEAELTTALGRLMSKPGKTTGGA